MLVVMAYGQIFSPQVLIIPPDGCINVHASILPRHRGASPIQSALLADEKETGICVMLMQKEMDSGPVFTVKKIKISGDDDAVSLHDKLAELSAQTVPDVLSDIMGGKLKAKPQNDSHATYCKKIQKTDGHINWNQDPSAIVTRVRAFAGWPGSYSMWNGMRLKVLGVRPAGHAGSAMGGKDPALSPGVIFEHSGKIFVCADKGSVELTRLQPECKKPQSASDFVNGHHDFIGSILK
jgi:methionyl-tRNA formyltransferase